MACMIHAPHVLAYLLAGGEGTRLQPLPADRGAAPDRVPAEQISCSVFVDRGAEATLRRTLHDDARTHIGRLCRPSRP